MVNIMLTSASSWELCCYARMLFVVVTVTMCSIACVAYHGQMRCPVTGMATDSTVHCKHTHFVTVEAYVNGMATDPDIAALCLSNAESMQALSCCCGCPKQQKCYSFLRHCCPCVQ